ncbi:hypothetical protein NQU36_29875, partial [Escherichia coli]|uniref:hypothetical protein n=1 Tax=Escherichia coli TaxID=562 RepID=UPI002118A14D
VRFSECPPIAVGWAFVYKLLLNKMSAHINFRISFSIIELLPKSQLGIKIKLHHIRSQIDEI